jgi:anti-anti-sigma factor
MTIALQEVDDRPRDDVAALRYEVAGPLDVDASEEVRAVERDPEPHSVVEIDLGRCSGMDSYGFGSLVGLIRRAREHQAHVRVRGAPDPVRDELRRTGVVRLVELLPTDKSRADRVPSR